MSEVYWIGGGQLSPPFNELTNNLSSTGIRPGWIDEAHWISADDLYLPEFEENLPSYRWPVRSQSAHRLLHLLLADLRSGSREILLLGERNPLNASYMLLGSPQAAGRHNLLPRFRLSDLPLVSEGGWNDCLSRWHQHIEGLLIESNSIAWVSAPGMPEALLENHFPEAHLATPNAENNGLLNQLHSLLARLEESRSSAALLIERDGLALATLIERL